MVEYTLIFTCYKWLGDIPTRIHSKIENFDLPGTLLAKMETMVLHDPRCFLRHSKAQLCLVWPQLRYWRHFFGRCRPGSKWNPLGGFHFLGTPLKPPHGYVDGKSLVAEHVLPHLSERLWCKCGILCKPLNKSKGTMVTATFYEHLITGWMGMGGPSVGNST